MTGHFVGVWLHNVLNMTGRERSSRIPVLLRASAAGWSWRLDVTAATWRHAAYVSGRDIG